jgi:hypothetical protein
MNDGMSNSIEMLRHGMLRLTRDSGVLLP